MYANITDIKRFAVHDGDGIRTTVFFKGCPLQCLWCHNPETISAKPQLAFYAHKCTLCSKCAAVCKNHKIADGKHIFHRFDCTLCDACVQVCPNEALIRYGKQMSCEEICDILLKDKDFYEESGGGITLSGGECLLQPDACKEILTGMKKAGIRTAIDTCGDVPFANFEKVLAETDIFLYDIKAIDETVHRTCTGRSNLQILDNIKKLDALGAAIEIRVPYVPLRNADELERIAEWISRLHTVRKVTVLPYHNYAHSKYHALGMPDTLTDTLPSDKETETAKQRLSHLWKQQS